MIITRPRGLGCQKVNRQPGGPSEPERSSDLIFALWSLAYMPVLSKGSRLGAPAHVGVSAISPFDLGGEVHSNRMTLQYAGRRTLARMDTSLAAATLLIVMGMIGMRGVIAGLLQGRTRVVLDLRAVTVAGPGLLGVLLRIRRGVTQLDGRLALVVAGPPLSDLVRTTVLAALIDIAADRDGALALVAPGPKTA